MCLFISASTLLHFHCKSKVSETEKRPADVSIHVYEEMEDIQIYS